MQLLRPSGHEEVVPPPAEGPTLTLIRLIFPGFCSSAAQVDEDMSSLAAAATRPEPQTDVEDCQEPKVHQNISLRHPYHWMRVWDIPTLRLLFMCFLGRWKGLSWSMVRI